jgi:hypothetical protein
MCASNMLRGTVADRPQRRGTDLPRSSLEGRVCQGAVTRLATDYPHKARLPTLDLDAKCRASVASPRAVLGECCTLVGAAHVGVAIGKPTPWRPFGTEKAAVRALERDGPPTFFQVQIKQSLHCQLPSQLRS